MLESRVWICWLQSISSWLIRRKKPHWEIRVTKLHQWLQHISSIESLRHRTAMLIYTLTLTDDCSVWRHWSVRWTESLITYWQHHQRFSLSMMWWSVSSSALCSQVWEESSLSVRVLYDFIHSRKTAEETVRTERSSMKTRSQKQLCWVWIIRDTCSFTALSISQNTLCSEMHCQHSHSELCRSLRLLRMNFRRVWRRQSRFSTLCKMKISFFSFIRNDCIVQRRILTLQTLLNTVSVMHSQWLNNLWSASMFRTFWNYWLNRSTSISVTQRKSEKHFWPHWVSWNSRVWWGLHMWWFRNCFCLCLMWYWSEHL